MRGSIEKEFERLTVEESTYPANTILILEEDRCEILEKLYASQKNLTTALEKFPVSAYLRSIKIQKKKAFVEKCLDEIEKVVRIFERNKVFLKR